MPLLPGTERRREARLQDEIAQLEDHELIQAAFVAYWDSYGLRSDIDARIRNGVLENLQAAEAQLKRQLALSIEARGRLRSTLFRLRLGRDPADAAGT